MVHLRRRRFHPTEPELAPEPELYCLTFDVSGVRETTYLGVTYSSGVSDITMTVTGIATDLPEKPVVVATITRGRSKNATGTAHWPSLNDPITCDLVIDEDLGEFLEKSRVGALSITLHTADEIRPKQDYRMQVFAVQTDREIKIPR